MMKTKNNILKTGVILAVMILMNGCLDYEITTQIYPDGRIERYFRVHGEYDMIKESSSITLPSDSTWEIKTWWELDDSSKNKPDSIYVYTARKIFKNYQELNEELKNAPDIYNKINIQVNLKRKFRWFYTFIEYREIYRKHFPYSYLPSGDFLTDDEIRYSLSDEKDYRYNPVKDIFEPLSEADTSMTPSKSDMARQKELDKGIKNRFAQWQDRNIFEDYCDALSKILSKKYPEAYQMMIDRKKEFYDSLDLEEAPDYDGDQEELLKLKNYITSRTSNFLHIPENDILPAKNSEIQRFYDRLAFLDLNMWYTYDHITIMPGRIIQTNSTELENGNSKWRLRLKDFYTSDYEMMVEARMVNKWAIVISIVVVCMMLAGLVIGFVKR